VDQTKILFIAGAGRSGTTLADRLLGQQAGWLSLGETCYLWDRALGENQLCGCGQPFRECLFWRDILADAFPGGVPRDHGLVLRDQVERIRLLPGFANYTGVRGVSDETISEYASLLARLFGGIIKHTDANVIVDSSKHASHGWALCAMSGFEVHVLHLVRDPRAVMHSWQRSKERPEIHWKREEMPRLRPTRATLGWIRENYYSERLARRAASFTRIRYEDVVGDPGSFLGSVSRVVCGREADTSFLKDHTATLHAAHTVSGNPMRFKTGPLALKPDVEWRHAMQRRDRYEVTALGFPLMARYGYHVKAR
jgi:hypothetical protein